MTRVLIGVPLYDQPELCFVRAMVDVSRLRDADYDTSIIRGTYVNVARNDIVAEARARNFSPDDEIIFLDADLEVTGEHISQLRSHNVDIVGGIYAKRLPGDPDWTIHATGEPAVNTLLPVNDVATGLLRIKMRVFDAIEALNPDRRYKNSNSDRVKYEFFPIGLVGQGTPEARLEAVRLILSEYDIRRHPSAILEQIRVAATKEVAPEHRDLYGEDVQFMMLAKKAGFKVWADMAVVVRHVGKIAFPARLVQI